MNLENGCPNMETMPMVDENMKQMSMGVGGCPTMPIYECPEERICHRYICYEVPHIKPCNTRIINHHVYKHTFTPYYTSCEENVVENFFERRCC